MDKKNLRSAPFQVRPAHAKDIPALMRLKRLLAQGENALHAVRASEADWLRDGFGPDAGFTAFVAEDFSGVIGMPQRARRHRLERAGDFPAGFVRRAALPRAGVASALMARVAALARDVGSPIVELTVRSDNPAQNFYLPADSSHCRIA